MSQHIGPRAGSRLRGSLEDGQGYGRGPRRPGILVNHQRAKGVESQRG